MIPGFMAILPADAPSQTIGCGYDKRKYKQWPEFRGRKSAARMRADYAKFGHVIEQIGAKVQ